MWRVAGIFHIPSQHNRARSATCSATRSSRPARTRLRITKPWRGLNTRSSRRGRRALALWLQLAATRGANCHARYLDTSQASPKALVYNVHTGILHAYAH